MLKRGNKAEREAVPVISPPSSNCTAMQNPPSPPPSTARLKSSMIIDAPGSSASTNECAANNGLEALARRLYPTQTIPVLLADCADKDPSGEHSPDRAGPLSEEKSISVRGPLSALDQVAAQRAASSRYDSSNSTSSSPTEHMLLGRHVVRPDSGREEHGEHCAKIRLTLARSLSNLKRGSTTTDHSLDEFSQELVGELCTALSVSVARFQIGTILETDSRSCTVDVTIFPSSEEDVFSTSALSSAQLALEVQRQVADPMAPLRGSYWFLFVMNVIITSGSRSVTPVASLGTYGVPLSGVQYGAPLLACAPDFGAPTSTLFGDSGGYGAPMDNFALPSAFTEKLSISDEMHAVCDRKAIPNKNVAKGREGIEKALNELRQQQRKPAQVMSWLEDSNLSGGSKLHDSSFSSNGQLQRSMSLPELHQDIATSRSALETENMGLRLRLASREAESSRMKQLNTELQQENTMLRSLASQLEASKQQSISEGIILRGLSKSQAKEIEAFQMQNRSLSAQLRDQKKRGNEKRPNNNLSEVFALEQQLHAEKARVAELMSALECANAGLARAMRSERVAKTSPLSPSTPQDSADDIDPLEIRNRNRGQPNESKLNAVTASTLHHTLDDGASEQVVSMISHPICIGEGDLFLQAERESEHETLQRSAKFDIMRPFMMPDSSSEEGEMGKCIESRPPVSAMHIVPLSPCKQKPQPRLVTKRVLTLVQKPLHSLE